MAVAPFTRTRLGQLSASAASEGHTEIRPANFQADATKYPVIALHGRGSGSTQFVIPPYLEKVTFALANQGRLVLSIDAGGTLNWGGPLAQPRITDAYNAASGSGGSSVNLGAKAGKAILVLFSMGTLGGLKWALDNPSKVACIVIMCGAVDLAAHHDTPTSAGDTAEIETAYTNLAGYQANVAAYNPAASPASFTGVPIKAWHASDDTRAPTAWMTSFRTAVGGSAFAFQDLGAVGHNPSTTDPAQVASFVAAQVGSN
jgi:pimeloyl-ACP methyl ester carboxylesterase